MAPPSNHWFFLRNNDKSWKWPHLAMLEPVFIAKWLFFAQITFDPMKSNDFDPSWLDFSLKMWSKSGLGQRAPPSNHWFFLKEYWQILKMTTFGYASTCFHWWMAVLCHDCALTSEKQWFWLLMAWFFHWKCGRNVKSPRCPPPVTIRFSSGIMAFPENDHVCLCLNPFSMMNACLCPQFVFV